ncbi:LacI family gluconate utilization system Gnt-I transcriptional repressor [Yoonia maritima]|uniref:LacI family gluconate utilization system Gnt-I transcriptional repressor n=1 Tax=Yoonia maritima TaxID=1435347 RepID=A0A2T0VX68_9RHOB|nr:LacI family DNA-binding transcriptional regulator [Yoonia maritima]PRY76622.1 LacI family gluconate utilization system Gnt-I transcriptional repressor [Yoonia maritima]
MMDTPNLNRKTTSRRVTMEDVGRLAGVSQVTVSRALSDPDKVSPKTLKKITDAIDATGFVPNAIAGALASKKSKLISALVPSITNIVYSAAVASFSSVMREHGYQVLLSETGFDPKDEEAMILTHLSRRPDAVLLTGIHHTAKARQMLLASDIPVVEIWDTTETPIDICVGFSHDRAAVKAAEYAFENGFTCAATLSAGDERALRRRAAFESRFAELAGAAVENAVHCERASLANGRDGLRALQAQSMEKGTFVFCSSDVLAHGMLIEASAQGLKVPTDIAIMGFGDQEFAAHTEPALTTVRVDRTTLGRSAAMALLSRFDSAEPIASVNDIGFEIVARHSA